MVKKFKFNTKQLETGIIIESKEHGLDRNISKKIAFDHLKENPNYYNKYIKKPGKRTYLTSRKDEHIHTWRYGDKRTSINSRHSHPIDFNKRIAKKGKTNHTHRLLRTIIL